MKKYSTPKLIEVCCHNERLDSIFPSTGAITGALTMLARSAAKASVQEKKCQPLQKQNFNK